MTGICDGTGRPVLVVMAKEPVPGQVKTRLAAVLGAGPAAELADELIAITLDNAQGGWPGEIVLCGSWQGSPGRLRRHCRGRGIELVRQRGAGLGQRMHRALRLGLERGPAAAIIGSDIPGLGPDVLETASRRLAEGVTVVGPSTDGGFYLLGVRYFDDRLFENAAFSHRRVFTDLQARLARAGCPAGCVLPELRDVDTPRDLRWAASKYDRLSRFAGPSTVHG